MTESASKLPLAGLKVVELHAIGPVPFAAQLLRSLGARVVRVSPPADPGLGVRVPPQYDLLNVGKEERLLDLKDGAGIDALHAELADAEDWHARQPMFWAVVVAPWVLVQEALKKLDS
jgi:crotonobetainyl-CoA:carnitine CoA-transferase CaiB-like acyl-CoA transferase